MLPVCMFSIPELYLATTAALFITVPTNHPQVREKCELCRSQSITRVALSDTKLGDEEVKARFQGGKGQLTVSRWRVEEIKNSREALTSTGHQTLISAFSLRLGALLWICFVEWNEKIAQPRRTIPIFSLNIFHKTWRPMLHWIQIRAVFQCWGSEQWFLCFQGVCFS